MGTLNTRHGKIPTPFFMPIATQGVVKNISVQELEKAGADIVLANTYHLYFKPGQKTLKKAKGLHNLMNWQGPMLTDSGGFQVFSLAHKLVKNKKPLVKIIKQGVYFQSVYDGSKHLFTPKKVLEIQKDIGSDIRMVLDICSPAKCSKKQAASDLAITLDWARAAKKNKSRDKSLLFGIVQGALFEDLRKESVEELLKLNFNGYAIGGLAVGEETEEMYQVLDYTVPRLPENKPRYLMGVGYPEQIVEAVKRGVDMFDCVIPTREARHGRLYYFKKRKQLEYLTINIKLEKFSRDLKLINPGSVFPELRQYTRAYLRHLFSINEPLAMRLATLNNLEFYLNWMKKIRENIRQGRL